MIDHINHDRRFVGTAVMTIAAAELGMTRPADPRATKPRTNPSAGPINDRAVILLNGWPYDIHSYVDVAPMLAAAGYMVIVTYLRDFGTTRFLSNETFRNGQPSAIALDIIALMDALKIEKAILAGFDWGARTADILAALWPERCTALVSVSGYLIGNPQANKMPLPPKAELQSWYQFHFAAERGRAGYEKYRRDFVHLADRFAELGLNDVTALPVRGGR